MLGLIVKVHFPFIKLNLIINTLVDYIDVCYRIQYLSVSERVGPALLYKYQNFGIVIQYKLYCPHLCLANI